MKKTTLKHFTIWIPTEFGLAYKKKEAKDFTDAFLKLGKKDRMKDGWITDDEDDQSMTFRTILGIEEM